MLNRKRLFLVKRGALKDVEGIGYDVEGCWGRQDVRSIPLVVEIFFYFLVFEPQWALGALETHDNKDIGGDLERPNFFRFWGNMGCQIKKDIEIECQ